VNERPLTVNVGEWRVTALADGYLRLDGGSMWGVVPATIWRKLTPPDEANRIRLALRPFLAERGAHKVLIEAGVGPRWDAKLREIYAIEPSPTLPDSLRAAGVEREEVTHVVASHCHWDHFGCAVVERNGKPEPLCPNARYFAPKVEIAAALDPGPVRRASYRREDVEPLVRSGRLEAYEGTFEILPGLRAHVLGGHSDGVSVITLDEERDDAAIFWSDVVPTAHHIQPPYIMAYDIDVLRSYEQRSKWLARAAERNWLGLFYHDEHTAFARLARDGKRYVARPVTG
jgi:glyoxylase-like metal-dependent hydrolase (beta-lactamase superfamily II)